MSCFDSFVEVDVVVEEEEEEEEEVDVVVVVELAAELAADDLEDVDEDDDVDDTDVSPPPSYFVPLPFRLSLHFCNSVLNISLSFNLDGT